MVRLSSTFIGFDGLQISTVISPTSDIPRIVGIGASAGGLDAMERFLSALPADSNLAYVIVQHLANDHESHLAELLARRTRLPIEIITAETVVEANTVYLRPPQIEIKIEGASIIPYKRITEGSEAYYPIDRFLVSLAEQRNEKAIAVILSGMGTDGTRGIDTVKERGGMVLIQSPDSAQFTGMPDSAIRQDNADLVGSPSELAERLVDMARLEGKIRQELAEEAGSHNSTLISELLRLIRNKENLDFTQYRLANIQRRVEKRMLVNRSTSNEAYLELVRSDVSERQTLAQSFLIGVTRFFRDEAAFKVLEEQIIPDLFSNANGGQPIRIWIPACSTGEEAYSVAMLLEEYRRKHDIELDFKLLASDIDKEATKAANRGYYSGAITADVPEHLLQRYFTPELGGYRIANSLRDRILFAVQNLIHDPPFIKIDLIVCRNFLIYVNVEAQARVLSTFHFSLNPTGFLFLGPSESLGKLGNAFSVIDRRWKVFTRRPHDSLPLPSLARARVQGNGEAEQNGLVAAIPRPDESTLPSPLQLTDPASFPMVRDPFAQYLADRYAPASLFVNEQYEIIYINGNVDGLLTFPRQHASFNLERVLDTEVFTILREAVDTVLAKKTEGDYEEVTVPDLRLRGSSYSTRVQSTTLYDFPGRLAVIIMRAADQPLDNGTATRPGRTASSDQLVRRRIQSLEEQLLQSNLKTQKLLSELEATNEELQTSNRELLASNEEMQSTNEELQSVNEELYTVNNEIQVKNEQLKLLNNDINRLLESTEIGTIFLSENLEIRRFTPTIRKQFDLHESDIGRPIASFSSSFPNLELATKCQRVLDDLNRYEEEIIDNSKRHFLLRVLPYRGIQPSESGLVVTFINISDLVDTRTRLEDMANKYQALLLHSEETILIVGGNGKIKEANKWMEDNYDADDLSDLYFSDLLESNDQRALFEKSLRKVIDDNSPEHIRLSLRGVLPGGLHTDMAIIPAHRDEKSEKEYDQPEVLVILRDVSEQLRNEYYTQTVIDDYRQLLDKDDILGGLLDLSGNIVYLNRSVNPEVAAEEFMKHKVQDYLAPSGITKFERMMERLTNGSFEESVQYLPEDLLIAPQKESGTLITYRPIISEGEIRLIGITGEQ